MPHNEDTTFGRLYRDSDNDVLEALDFAFKLARDIDKCIKVAQRPDEFEECPGSVKSYLNSLI